MTIALGTYLSGVKGVRVAVAEADGRGRFADMAEAYYGDSNDTEFRLMDIDYYVVASVSELAWIYSRGYDYVVISFGILYEKYMAEVARCSVKLVLGSVNLWRYADYVRLCRCIREVHGSSGWLHIISGDNEDIKEHLKREGVTGVKRVVVDSPYIIGSEQLEFFRKIV